MVEEKKQNSTDNNKSENTEEQKDSLKKFSFKKIIVLVGIVFIVIVIAIFAAIFFMGGEEHFSSHNKNSDNMHDDVEHVVVDSDHFEHNSEHNQESSHKKDTHTQANSNTTSYHSIEQSSPEEDSTTFGEIYTFKPFQLNLGNPLENRFIKIEIAVEYKGSNAQKAEIIKREAQLRDAIIGIVGRKTREFLLSPDGKDQLRREIKIKLNRFLSQPIDAVYITEMLID